MYKVGDKVSCIDDTGGLEIGKIYTVKEVFPHITNRIMLSLQELQGGYWDYRFKNMNRKLKLERVLRCSK